MTKPRDAHNSAKTGRRTVNKKPDMPDSVDEAKKVLTVLAEHLRELPNKGRSLTFAEHAISSFLDRKHKTLDRAFGLKQKAPRVGTHNDLARKIWPLRETKHSWKTIADKVQWFDDVETLRKNYAREKSTVVRDIANILTDRLNKSDKKSVK